jgi:AcrR family transcriptional regulator
MARNRDEGKRAAILQASKTLFSRKGFAATSISDIVGETGMTVGTIYTYFKSKEEIVRVIVDEGWKELYGRMEEGFSKAATPEDQVKVIIERAIPAVLTDADFVNILVTEAVTYTRLEDKLEQVTDLAYPLVRSLLGRRGQTGFKRDTLRTALVVIALGIMSTVRVGRATSLGIGEREVVSFVRTLARESLGMDL